MVPDEWGDRLVDIWAELSDSENYARDSRAADTRWRPSIHMPRWASRITLVVTDVRVERLQEIDDEDAGAEGVKHIGGQFEGCYRMGSAMSGTTAVECFARAWNALNAKRGHAWATNPWVWVITATSTKPSRRP